MTNIKPISDEQLTNLDDTELKSELSEFLTLEELAAWDEAERKATKGPWESNPAPYVSPSIWLDAIHIADFYLSDDDAAFTILSRNLAPRAIETIRVLTAERDKLHRAEHGKDTKTASAHEALAAAFEELRQEMEEPNRQDCHHDWQDVCSKCEDKK